MRMITASMGFGSGPVSLEVASGEMCSWDSQRKRRCSKKSVQLFQVNWLGPPVTSISTKPQTTTEKNN